tara:strand:- start:5965 stop:6153 length:189 start_codon:yes stop_codon:yes gene_type:complete
MSLTTVRIAASIVAVTTPVVMTTVAGTLVWIPVAMMAAAVGMTCYWGFLLRAITALTTSSAR